MAKDRNQNSQRELEPVVPSKADLIRNSKMPDAQKEACLREIGEIKDKPFNPNEVTFHVYATVRKIPVDMQKAMLVYPKANGVRLATLTEWDEIFKQF